MLKKQGKYFLTNLELIQSVKQRFLSKFTESDTESCWEWNGTISTNQYGMFTVYRNSRNYWFTAHRASFMLYNNINLENKLLYVCHVCDNRRCVNPNHLFLGSPTDNNVDMTNKGRQKCTIGSQRYNAKLKEQDIPVIRGMLSSGDNCNTVAKKFGVNIATIYYIKTGRNWKHVTDERIQGTTATE